MRKPDRSLVIISATIVSALALCGLSAGYSFAQVYKGVIPDQSGSSSGSSGQTSSAADQGGDNTYGGAIAPVHKSKTAPDPGYRGVMPGYVAPAPKTQNDTAAAPKDKDKEAKADDDDEDKPAPAKPQARPMTPARRTPQMSYAPGYEPPHIPSAEEFRRIAAISGVELNVQALPAELAQNVHIRHKVYALVSGSTPRIDGMLQGEFTTKRLIDESMQKVNDPSLSDDERKKAVGDAIQQLSSWGTYVRTRNNIPDGVYQALGAPGVFVEETREAMTKSDARLDEAIRQLREMQQQ